MSHHLSGPNLRSPADDARLDLTDLFAFPAAGGYRTVLIMNLNPDFSGSADAFHPQAVYRINLDTDADNQADVAFSVVFSDPADSPQTFTVHRATGDQAHTQEATGEVIASGELVSVDRGGHPSLTAFFNPEEALRTVLPDVLHYDRDRPAAYPNGRALTDDVLDARLAMVTNGKVAGDQIGPHTDLLADFPYLGHPHR